MITSFSTMTCLPIAARSFVATRRYTAIPPHIRAAPHALHMHIARVPNFSNAPSQLVSTRPYSSDQDRTNQNPANEIDAETDITIQSTEFQEIMGGIR